MSANEAKARIKINNLLIQSGWRFFDDENEKANISLENNVTFIQEKVGVGKYRYSISVLIGELCEILVSLFFNTEA